ATGYRLGEAPGRSKSRLFGLHSGLLGPQSYLSRLPLPLSGLRLVLWSVWKRRHPSREPTPSLSPEQRCHDDDRASNLGIQSDLYGSPCCTFLLAEVIFCMPLSLCSSCVV
ncbi:hypothetical protein DVH24_013515, partial [Malus domestica]